LPVAFSELYPTRIRANGAGFCTSFGRGFGSIMPAAVGFASASMGLAAAMGTFAIVSYAIAFIAALCLPNATGVQMTDDHPVPLKAPDLSGQQGPAGAPAQGSHG
jgi:hypothetical protein